MLHIRDIVENTEIRLGKYLKIRPTDKTIKRLKQEFGYNGYCRLYPESNYNFLDYTTYDYNAAMVKSAIEGGITWGILKTLISILETTIDPEKEGGASKFLLDKLKADFKGYDKMLSHYGKCSNDIIKKARGGIK